MWGVLDFIYWLLGYKTETELEFSSSDMINVIFNDVEDNDEITEAFTIKEGKDETFNSKLLSLSSIDFPNGQVTHFIQDKSTKLKID